MLVHKKTMGALGEFWTGELRSTPTGAEPVMHHARLSDFPWLDSEDWWEVPDGGALARKILLHYPQIEPVVGEDGRLDDVTPVHPPEQVEALRMEEAQREQMQKTAAARGYRRVGRVRPLGMFNFLNDRCIPPSHDGAVPAVDAGDHPWKFKKKGK